MKLRSSQVTLSAVFLALIPTVAACAEDPETAEICVDQNTQVRVDDDDCEDSDGVHTWVYVPWGHAPRVGSKVSGFSTVKTGTVGRAPAEGTSSGG